MEIDRRVVIASLAAVAATRAQTLPVAAEMAASGALPTPIIIPYQSPEFVIRMAFGLWHKLKADAVAMLCEDGLLSFEQARLLARESSAIEWAEAFDFYPHEIIGRSEPIKGDLSLHLEDGRSFTIMEMQQIALKAVARSHVW